LAITRFEVEKMPMLKVKCKTKGCGLDFASGINIDERVSNLVYFLTMLILAQEVILTNTIKQITIFRASYTCFWDNNSYGI
jgi:hypothetical protein